MPVTASSIGRDDQLFGLRVALTAHTEPPTPNGLHSKRRCVVVCTNAHPGLVSADVINPIRIGSAEFLVDEVVNFDFYRLPAGQPLLACVLVRADEFLLLGVDRNHGLIGLQGRSNRGVDMFELGVTVRALVSFKHLDVALQAVVLLLQELAHHDVTHCVATCLKLIGQMTQTLARPAQWRLRVTSGRSIHERQKVGQ